MDVYEITKTFLFDENDIVDIISSAVYDIGYWACIDNSTETWVKMEISLDDDCTFEDVFFEILKSGQAVRLIDAEGDEGTWELTLTKLLKGIRLAIDDNYWDGKSDSLDGDVGDIIFQYALFDEIVYG